MKYGKIKWFSILILLVSVMILVLLSMFVEEIINSSIEISLLMVEFIVIEEKLW